MHDWMFEPGHDPLRLTLSEQPWSPDPDATTWFSPAPADDFQTWLLETPPKGSLDDFGPMFLPDLVSTLDDVEVTGERLDFDAYIFLSTDYVPSWWGDQGSGGGGGGPPPQSRSYDACEDRAADTLAEQINNEIAAQPDSDTREYGALIWRDDAGNLHRTALVPGTNDRVNWPADPSTLGLDSYSRVVGMVHSHPTMVELSGGQWVSATHTGIHGRDWAAADGWVTMHNLDRANFTMYISDRGAVREYDYADNTSNSRQARTDQGSVESGDYNPGSSCP